MVRLQCHALGINSLGQLRWPSLDLLNAIAARENLMRECSDLLEEGHGIRRAQTSHIVPSTAGF